MIREFVYTSRAVWLWVLGSLLLVAVDSENSEHSTQSRTLLQDETEVDCQCKAWEQKVVSSSEVPGYMRQKYIDSHYRPVSCFNCALVSVTGRHNETVNIFTSICGLVLVLALALRFGLVRAKAVHKELSGRHIAAAHAFMHPLSSATKSAKLHPWMPLWPLLTFDLLTAVAFLVSFLSHTFACMPEQHSAIWWMMDQVGITLGAMGVNIVAIIYLLHNSALKTLLRHLYTGTAVVALAGTLSVFASWIPTSNAARVPLLGIGAVLRMLYIAYPAFRIWNEKKSEVVYKETLHRYCAAAGVLAAGILVQATLMPEVLSPGTFDVYGASHQLLHVCVVVCVSMFHFANERLWEILARQEASKALQALANCETSMNLSLSATFMSCSEASIDMQTITESGICHTAELKADSSKMSTELVGRRECIDAAQCAPVTT